MLTPLRVRPGVRATVELRPSLLVGEGVGERLSRTDTADVILPTRGTAVIAHIDILLHLTGNDIVKNDVTSRPAARLKPG